MIRILVLEDDAKLNQMVCTYLNDSGFQAKGCLHANDAYDEMYNSLYDLIISDIMMPDIDGFEFAESVRRVNKHIPILFMSAKDDLPSKQRGYQLGIDDYMVKPIQLDELLLRVRALLRRANIEMERKVVVGNLELDADGMTASVDGEELPVTTREFNILYAQRRNTKLCGPISIQKEYNDGWKRRDDSSNHIGCRISSYSLRCTYCSGRYHCRFGCQTRESRTF